MYLAKKLIASLLLPPIGLLLLAFAGLWLSRRHPRLGRGIVLAGLLGMFALSVPLVAERLMASLETYPPITTQQLAQAQAIVILGGGNYEAAPEYGGDTVSYWTLERLRYGAYLQRQSGLPILVTGGSPFGGRPEGETMKEALERDLHGSVKWAENESRDTAENAAYSAVILKTAGITRIALVSQAWHLPRAAELFERQGLQPIPAPTGFTTHPSSLFIRLLPSSDAFAYSSRALREWLGRLAQQFGKPA